MPNSLYMPRGHNQPHNDQSDRQRAAYPIDRRTIVRTSHLYCRQTETGVRENKRPPIKCESHAPHSLEHCDDRQAEEPEGEEYQEGAGDDAEEFENVAVGDVPVDAEGVGWDDVGGLGAEGEERGSGVAWE